jgi:hypothetical protein
MQSAKLSFQSSELGPPPPPRKGVLLYPPFGSKGGDKLACGRGSGGTQPEEGTDTLHCSMVIIEKV